VCGDPGIVKLDAAGKVKASAKRERLLELLEALVAEGRSVLVFSQFVSMLRQDPTDYTLLPIAPPPAETADADNGEAELSRRDISLIYEPSAPEVLAQLLPRYVGVVVYETILESLASELSARMVAMRNATENATELLRDLQLNYNKARQAAITREMIDVTSGMLTA